MKKLVLSILFSIPLIAQTIPFPGPGVLPLSTTWPNGYLYRTQLTVTAGQVTLSIASGTYVSGITAVGTMGQTCNLGTFNGGGLAAATVALSGVNTVGSTITFSSSAGFSSAPTSAAVSNGSAVCTGTATISTTLSPLSNYPTVATLSSTHLATVANGGAVQHTATQTVGTYTLTVPADFVFATDTMGASPISRFVFKTYSATGGTAIVYFNNPTIQPGTTIYAFYGNAAVTTLQGIPTSTWNANFLGVWLFPDGSTLNASDFTSHGTNGTVMGATAAVGLIDGGASSNGGGSQFISMGANQTILQPAHTITMECWIKPLSATQGSFATMLSQDFNNPRSSPFVGYALGLNNAGNGHFSVAYSIGGILNTLDSGISFTNGSWTHVASTYNSGPFIMYINGAQTATASGGSTITYTNTGIFGVLANGDSTNQVNAVMDDCKIMGVASPPDWIANDYRNGLAPNTFWTITYDVLF